MISKAAILERASEWQLTPDVVEKDYVLGWVLAGIAHSSDLSTTWIFKGGTCLKKCIMETYRFSEDLDFTLLPEASYSADEILRQLRDVATSVTELSGIQCPITDITVHERRDRAGAPTFEARMAYSGPMAVPGPPKIRLDLTRNEPVLRTPEAREIGHPYPDTLPPDTRVRCYSLGELVAEKTRALRERTRPRDLYDIVLLGSEPPAPEEATKLREIAVEKFRVKNLQLPSVAELVRIASGSAELRSEWGNMLGRQLPATPPVDDFLARLPGAVAWLDAVAVSAAAAIPRPVSAPYRAGETLVAPRGIQMWRAGSSPEAARFAGASQLLIEFMYHGARRLVEPYSLRRPGAGNLLLYGWEQRKNGVPIEDIRAYKVAEIQSLRVTNQSFRPRYAIELTERPGVWRW